MPLGKSLPQPPVHCAALLPERRSSTEIVQRSETCERTGDTVATIETALASVIRNLSVEDIQ